MVLVPQLPMQSARVVTAGLRGIAVSVETPKEAMFTSAAKERRRLGLCESSVKRRVLSAGQGQEDNFVNVLNIFRPSGM